MENQSFFPFGAQYYRAPTPLHSEWATDIKNMRTHGFNTIKIWAQWRANNPKPGVYDFDDLRTIMDLSAENGLKVIINIIMDVAPAWFYKQHPDSIMICADGTKLMPMTTEYRQIGGAPGPCYHHPDAISIKREFVEQAAKQFAGHPALYIWDLWNEPELTCGIAREPSESKMPCYCEHSRLAFIDWLKEKYGTIEAVNDAWKRNFQDFDELELPRNPRSFNDMMDWRRFFSDTLTDDLADRIAAVRAFDSVTPVMVHTVPPPYFNMINACTDDYQMAKLCDMFGNSIGSSPFPATLSACSAKDKTVINAEIHALGGETFNHPRIPDYNELKSHIFVPMAKGIKGFVFWQYRPELLGRESPAWGLTDYEGNTTESLETVKLINNYIQENADFFSACRPEQASIAIIKDNDNERFAWCANATTEKYNSSLMGAYAAFHNANFNVDIITADQLLDQDVFSYSMIYYPLPYYMTAQVANRLKDYVESGGTLVSECYFGGYRGEVNLHSTRLPGYGFDEVFGVKEGESTTVSRFMDAYSANWSVADRDRSLTNISYTTLSGEIISIPGYYFCEELIGGEIIGRFEGGKGAVTICRYGKGKAVFAGSLLGAGYTHAGKTDTAASAVFADLAARAGVFPSAQVTADAGVYLRVDVLRHGDRLLIIMKNEGDAAGAASVMLRGSYPAALLKNMDNRETITLAACEGGAEFKCIVQPGEVLVYFSE